MTKYVTRNILALAISSLGMTSFAGEVPKGYNTEIPHEIMTPDRVETRIGVMEFVDGRPTDETIAAVYDNLDFLRGVEVFLNFIPAASIEGMRRGMLEMGQDAPNKVLYFEKLMDSNPLFLTGNTDTVYASVVFDMSETGPIVFDVPEGLGPSTVNDAFFRFVTDMGAPGPDKGKGGKYLILPPDYEGDLSPPEGGMEASVDGVDYFVSRSPSYVNWFIARGFLVDGKPDAANKILEEGLRVYPLKDKDSPPEMEFIAASEQAFNTIHANSYEFYEELDAVIQREPASNFSPELLGMAAAIGLQKGSEFAPDERMEGILRDAIAVGNASARAISFAPRMDGAFIYEDSAWQAAFVGGDYKWLIDNGNGGRNLDARTLFFYLATVNTPAMVVQKVGVGSQYAWAARDADGNYLDGAKTYKLNIPKDVPAKDFWSVVIYDPQTRSELQTSQPFPSKNSKRNDLIVNEDGSVDIYFGPSAPEGFEKNWIETIDGKGWFTILRLYGPLETYFDKSWRPGEIELID